MAREIAEEENLEKREQGSRGAREQGQKVRARRGSRNVAKPLIGRGKGHPPSPRLRRTKKGSPWREITLRRPTAERNQGQVSRALRLSSLSFLPPTP